MKVTSRVTVLHLGLLEQDLKTGNLTQRPRARRAAAA
jgi:hypothetical protein